MFFGRLLLTTCLIAISAPISALEFESNADIRNRHAFFKDIDSFIDNFFNTDYVVASKKKKKKKKDDDKKSGTTSSLSGTISSTNKESGNQSKQGKAKSAKGGDGDSSPIHKSESSSNQSQSQSASLTNSLAKINVGTPSEQTIGYPQQEAQKNANLDYTKNSQRSTSPAAVEAEASSASANGKAAQQTSGDSYIPTSSDRASTHSPSYSNNYYDFERTPRYEPTPQKSYYDSMMEKIQDLFSANEDKPIEKSYKPTVAEDKSSNETNFDDFFEKLEKEFANKIKSSKNKDNLSVDLEEIEREITTYRQQRNKSEPRIVNLKTSNTLDAEIKDINNYLENNLPVYEEFVPERTSLDALENPNKEANHIESELKISEEKFESQNSADDLATEFGIELRQKFIDINNKKLQKLEEQGKQIQENAEKTQKNFEERIGLLEEEHKQIDEKKQNLNKLQQKTEELRKTLFGNAAPSHSDSVVVAEWIKNAPIPEDDNLPETLEDLPPIIDDSSITPAHSNEEVAEWIKNAPIPEDYIDISQLSEAPPPPEEDTEKLEESPVDQQIKVEPPATVDDILEKLEESIEAPENKPVNAVSVSTPKIESPMEALWRTMSHRRQYIEPDSQNNSFIEEPVKTPRVETTVVEAATELEKLATKAERRKSTSYTTLQSRNESTPITNVPLADQLRQRSSSLKPAQTNVRNTNSAPIDLEKSFENIWGKKTDEDDIRPINPHMPEREDSEWDD